MNKVRAEFIVHGFVQGVGFRFYVHRNASALNLSGFAQNLYDGSVKVVTEGDKDLVEELFRLLKIGPTRSVVEKVEASYGEYTGDLHGFNIC